MSRYLKALDNTSMFIDGFESPFGLELLSSVAWLVSKEHLSKEVSVLEHGLYQWCYQKGSGERKAKLCDSRVILIALDRLNQVGQCA